MIRSREFEQARSLVAHLRSNGAVVQLMVEHDGTWVGVYPPSDAYITGELDAQIRSLRGEILAVLELEASCPVRVVGSRRKAS